MLTYTGLSEESGENDMQ